MSPRPNTSSRNARVGVFIPFKGECKLVLDCIYSLLTGYASGYSFFIVCYDDGSTIDELNYLYVSIKNNFPHDIVIVRNEPVGYTQAVHNITNFCLDRPDIDYLLLLNSDVKMRNGSLYALVNRMNRNPYTAAVGGKIIKMGTNEIQHTGTRLERRLWTNGCATLYNLRILRKEGLNFSLDFKPAYFEEADLMSELNLRGYAVLYEPKAEIEHKLNATMNKERDKYERVFWENWDKYKRKWEPYYNSKALAF